MSSTLPRKRRLRPRSWKSTSPLVTNTPALVRVSVAVTVKATLLSPTGGASVSLLPTSGRPASMSAKASPSSMSALS
ncbi:hypothetical protein D3C72_1780540 [compost metagenome]